jgi:hypothetical protein
MSTWYDVKKTDIDLSDDGKEIYFWLYDDNNGNVYCSAKVEDVKEIIELNQTHREGQNGLLLKDNKKRRLS